MYAFVLTHFPDLEIDLKILKAAAQIKMHQKTAGAGNTIF